MNRVVVAALLVYVLGKSSFCHGAPSLASHTGQPRPRLPPLMLPPPPQSTDQGQATSPPIINDFRQHALDVGNRLADLLKQEITFLSKLTNTHISDLDSLTVPNALAKSSLNTNQPPPPSPSTQITINTYAGPTTLSGANPSNGQFACTPLKCIPVQSQPVVDPSNINSGGPIRLPDSSNNQGYPLGGNGVNVGSTNSGSNLYPPPPQFPVQNFNGANQGGTPINGQAPQGGGFLGSQGGFVLQQIQSEVPPPFNQAQPVLPLPPQNTYENKPFSNQNLMPPPTNNYPQPVQVDTNVYSQPTQQLSQNKPPDTSTSVAQQTQPYPSTVSSTFSQQQNPGEQANQPVASNQIVQQPLQNSYVPVGGDIAPPYTQQTLPSTSSAFTPYSQTNNPPADTSQFLQQPQPASESSVSMAIPQNSQYNGPVSVNTGNPSSGYDQSQNNPTFYYNQAPAPVQPPQSTQYYQPQAPQQQYQPPAPQQQYMGMISQPLPPPPPVVTGPPFQAFPATSVSDITPSVAV